MQKITKRGSQSNDYIKSYGKMRGINLLPTCLEDGCYCYLENMYVDYESGGGAVESIPGFRRLYTFDGAIHLICSAGEYLLIHAGEGLYKIKKEERDNLPALRPIASLDDSQSYAYSHNGITFITDGKKIISVNAFGVKTEYFAQGDAVGCTAFASHEGELFLMNNKSQGTYVYLARIDEADSVISAEYCFTAPKNALSMLSAHGYLWIFTSDAVLGYKKSDGVFREEFRIDGVCPTSEACLLNNELFFLAKDGLYSIWSEGKARLIPRSNAINPMLLMEDLTSARITVWRGYLVVSVDGRMYLADSKDKLTSTELNEYRWYYLCGIGTHRGDKTVYRYSEIAPEGFSMHQSPCSIADGEIMSVQDENHETIYFVCSEDKRYSVYPTEERYGGVFFPAKCIHQSDNLLFFGTECNDLCLFNSDMRAKAPKHITESPGFNVDEYEAVAKGRIHPEYYSFDRHAPRYALLTPSDDCDIPFDKKSDKHPALALRLKSFPASTVFTEISYDGGAFITSKRISNSAFDFYNLNFESHSASSEECYTEILPKRRVGWTKKQIALYSKEYCSPFGVYEISFAYKGQKSRKHYKKGT